MQINRRGTTRIVIVHGDVVIKIPNVLRNWQTLIKGLLSNINEHQTWVFNSGRYEKGLSCLLCPVKWCSWGGWILVMQRVDKLINHDEFWDLNDPILKDHMMHFSGDDSSNNYGYLDGRLVKIDYAELNNI